MKLIAVLALATLLAACGQKTILMEAEGAFHKAPDVVRVRADLSTDGDTMESAVNRSNARVRAAVEKLHEAGYDSKDITIEQFSAERNCHYDDSTRSQVCKGYSVEQDVVVRLTNLDRTGDLLALLSDAGFDEIGTPSFGLTDYVAAIAAARTAAIENAKKQAASYAKASGWRLGKIVGVESSEAVGTHYSELGYVRELEPGQPTISSGRGRSPTSIVVTGSRVTRVPVTQSVITVSDAVFVKFELEGSWSLLGDKTWF
jgi:uncharacterized protein YggE